MPHELLDLEIEEISGVDAPANGRKFLVIKRAEPAQDVEKQDGNQASPMTTGDILAQQQLMEQMCRVKGAFSESLYRIFESTPIAEQPVLLQRSLTEFLTHTRAALAQAGQVAKGAPLLGEIEEVTKAGRKISAERMRRLKEVVAQIEAILMEAETMPTEVEKQVELIKAENATLAKQADEAKARVLELERENSTLKTDLAKAQELALAADPEAQVEALLKELSPAQRRLYDLQKADLAEKEAMNKALRDRMLQQDCIQKAQKYRGLGVKPDDHWEVFKDLDTCLPQKSREQIYQWFNGLTEQLKDNVLFKAYGRDGMDDTMTGDVVADVQKMARAKVKNGEAATEHEAMAQVFAEDRKLHARYRKAMTTRREED